MRLFNSLGSALGLYFTAAAVVPLLFFGVIADRFLYDLHVAQIVRELNQHAADIRDKADALVGDTLDDMLFIGSECDSRYGDGAQKIDALLKRAVFSKPYYQSIFLLDNQHQVRNLGLAGKLSGQEEDYRGLDLSNHDLLSGDYMRINTQSGNWSEVFVSMTTGETSISLGIPLEHGMLLGTIGLRLLGETINERIALRKDIVFAIIDHHGTLVAHSRPELVLQRTNLLAQHPEIAEALASGKEIVSRLHEDNSLFESIHLTKGPGWVVHATLDREKALQPLRQVRALLLLTVSIAILISVTLALWLSRRIARPLLHLRDTTGALARGDYSVAASIRGARFSEVDELARDFRKMADNVRDREVTLRESEERFRFLVEGMGEGLIIIDRNGVVVECNPAAERIFGLEREKLIGAGPVYGPWTTICEDGSVFPEEEHPARIVLREGIEISNQLMGLQRAVGRESWIQINSRPIFAADGTVDKALVTFSDVTGLKMTEESLRLSKLRFQDLYQQFSALLEGITDRIVLISPDWTLLWSNQASPGGCIDTAAVTSGDCCYSQFFDRSEPCPACPAVQAFATGEPAYGDVSGSDGRLWNMRAFPVFGKGGTISGVVMIAADITDKRESERQRVRAGQLAALGELAAGVAHEINNPISGVINYAQLIINRVEEGSREHDLAQRIIKEGNRIAVIVRELLTFSREESNDIRIVSVREALAEALALCEAQLRKEGVELHIDLPAALPPVESRSHQIQQLFLNLISNARHALAEKFPEPHSDKVLRISGRQFEIEGRPYLSLKVKDHGTGIPPELLERVMNPFVTTKPAGVGTGLGLSISFEIVKKHEGVLSIASEYGAWTEVTVELPACRGSTGGL